MKLSGKIIAKILTLCGISLTCTACYAPGGAMYEYKMNVEGLVLDEVSGDPIEGIKVRSSSTHSRADSVLTNAEGEFAFMHSMHFPRKITVEVEDVDGPENGGEYASQSKEVELTDENFYPLDGEGGPNTDWKGNWEVDFELTLKTQEDGPKTRREQ